MLGRRAKGETELRRTEYRRSAFSELDRDFLDLGLRSQVNQGLRSPFLGKPKT